MHIHTPEPAFEPQKPHKETSTVLLTCDPNAGWAEIGGSVGFAGKLQAK